ncbi:MAG: hypothetical protein WC869_12595 [Phycisphaerae bacterium]|jgi:hypothetical protein
MLILLAVAMGGCIDINALLGARQGKLFYAYDVLTPPHREVTLSARLQKSTLGKIKEIPVGFYDSGGRLLGVAKTDSHGRANFPWQGGPVGDYRFTARVMDSPRAARKHVDELNPAPLLVAARDPNSPIVIIDLDHTIVAGGAWDAMKDYPPPAMPGAREVTRRITKDYVIVYLTYRPDVLTDKSRRWLDCQGFPSGPLVASTMHALLENDSEEFKSQALANIRKDFPNLRIGIGDRASDAQAYVDSGMVAYLIPHYKEDPAKMRDMAEDIRKLDNRGKMQAVRDWKQIERGIFDHEIFTPQAYADWLTGQAEEMEKRAK